MFIKRALIPFSILSILSISIQADDDLKAQIDALNKKIKKLEKKQKFHTKMLSKVNKQSANDNIKFTMDFRTAYHNLDYGYLDEATKHNGQPDSTHAGHTYSNPSLLTSRMWLGMGAKASNNLTFFGQIALYGYWGASTNEIHTAGDNGWRGSSRPHDMSIRLRQGYFVYSFGKDWSIPVSISAGRRPATDGFLANHREGTRKPFSPLAHITNMEVDGAMARFDLSDVLLPGAYLKTVYGRAHDPVDRHYGATPYIDSDGSDGDKAVDFFVFPMNVYYDGQSTLMAQYALINNSKGARINDKNSSNLTKKAGAGIAHLAALSYQMMSLDEDSEFLDESTVFASAAISSTAPNSGHLMLGSDEPKTGYSFWAGFIFPDMLSDGGKFGFEYNWGSKYWTPMTWAEDTVIGSKIATRGHAYEAYWNLPIEGKHLMAQLRYTRMQYDYRANTTCYWDDPDDINLEYAQEVRAFLRYVF